MTDRDIAYLRELLRNAPPLTDEQAVRLVQHFQPKQPKQRRKAA